LPAMPKVKARKKAGLEKVEFKGVGSKIAVMLNKKDREKFLKELSIREQFLKKLKKRRRETEEEYGEFKKARGYLKLANRFFLKRASKMIKKGRFKDLSVAIRKANINVLFETYIAMVLFSVFLSAIVSVIILIVLLFVDVGITWPFFEIYTGSFLLRFAKLVWIPVIIPLMVFLGFYVYPSSERKSISNKINEELPFAVIHMSAISGSGITPAEIFKIIGLGKEYPYLKKEIRKILNQINLYGYDLVTALNNASKTVPSEKLAELFSGLSTTITSGANISEFLEKRAESLLLNYRLEREGYTKLVETFLDIYISVVIAAPMIFLLLLIMMLISGIDIGLSSIQITLLSVAGIAVLNIFFLVLLQVKQPSY